MIAEKLRNGTVNDTGENEDKEQGKKRVKAKQRTACFSKEKQNEDVVSTHLFTRQGMTQHLISSTLNTSIYCRY